MLHLEDCANTSTRSQVLLLYREKIITAEMAQPAKQPLLIMMDLIIETLQACSYIIFVQNY